MDIELTRQDKVEVFKKKMSNGDGLDDYKVAECLYDILGLVEDLKREISTKKDKWSWDSRTFDP